MSRCRRDSHRAWFARWLLVLGMLLGAAPVAAQAAGGGTPDTLSVVNHARATYRVDGSDLLLEATGTSTVRVARRVAVALDSVHDRRIAPGAQTVLFHRLTNRGEAADPIRVELAAPAGWGATLLRDVDGDGRAGPGDLPLAGSLTLGAGESAGLLVVVSAPQDAVPGTPVTVEVRATSGVDASVSDRVEDRLTVDHSAPQLAVQKTVDLQAATAGDTLLYSLPFANTGAAAAGAVLEDSLPAGLRVVAGSLRLDGAPLSDADDGDAGGVARGATGPDVVRFDLGTLAPGRSGAAQFRAVVASGTGPGVLSNVAVLRAGGQRVVSPAARTAVELPAVRLAKERLGTDTVRAGGEITFRLRYGNLSSRFPLRALELVDSLPEGLAFVSSDRPARMDGRVVAWTLGDLAPGDSGAVTVVTRVSAQPGEGAVTLLNRATIHGSNVSAVSVTAAAVEVTPHRADDLRLTKTAGVLEVAIGDAIPYTIVLENRGAAPLRDVVLTDVLPAGTRLIPRVVEGVDSLRAEGQTVRLFVAGPIAPAARRTIRYAVLVLTAGRSPVLVNRASAVAQGGVVRTATDSAVVRMRRPAGLQVQALIGKVWLDRNDNGRQEPGEEGVRGAEVLSADGQVVTTDAEGRFTFPETPAGVQLIRLDMLRVPAGFTVPGRGDDQVVVRTDGWTIPRVNFRLVPRPDSAAAAPAAPGRPAAPAAGPAPRVPTAPTAAPAQLLSGALLAAANAAKPAGAARHARADSLAAAPRPARAPAPAQAPPLGAAGRRPIPAIAPPARVGAVLRPVGTATVAAGGDTTAAATPASAPTTPAAGRTAAPAGATRPAPAAAPVRAAAPSLPTAVPALPAVTAPRPAAAPARPEPTPAAARPAAAPTVLVAPADSAPRVAPARTAAEREADAGRDFLVGPAVRFLAPVDGVVVSTNRIAVVVLGEPGAPLRLLDGDSVLAQGHFRPDGRAEFAGVDLRRGPHRLRVEMTNSWNQARWDSVAVHYSGDPARIELAEPASLRASARDTAAVLALVRDEWGVPVAGRPMVTVAVGGARLLGSDADRHSAGVQLQVARNGALALALVPEREPGLGSLTLTARRARARVPVRVLPSDRALTATGIGQVGIGSAPESFGAVLMQGAVGEETFVTLSYDSRRSERGSQYFQRGYDPLDESHYPTYGDGSERRVLSGATQTFSAKVQHGFDWLELGDVRVDFGDRRLAGYQRSLTGMSGRLETGAVTWRGFGSVTDQSLISRQIRGEGTSGPYRLGTGVRPGTERLAVEVRARENAARLLQRQELVRGFDYQIDYALGEVILQRAIPSADGQGNPVYLVGAMELRSGGESRFVGGLRMEMDGSRLVRRGAMDSLGVALFGVHDGAAGGALGGSSALLGGDLQMRLAGFSVGAALMRSAGVDSSAVAGRVLAAWEEGQGRARVEGEWVRVGQGFSNAADPRLSGGLQEVRLAGKLRLNPGSIVTLTHERQRFDQYGVERHNTLAEVQQSIAGRPFSAAGGLSTDMRLEPALTSSSLAVAKMSFAPMDRLRVWAEANHNVASGEGARADAVRPDQLAAGVSFRVLPTVSLEGSHRWFRMGGDSVVYGVTGLNLRLESLLGGQVWGGVEQADNRAGHAMVLGWNQKLALNGGWTATSLFERRFGVAQAPLADPVRALPFPEVEQNHWAASVGVEYLPGAGRTRVSTIGEVRDAGTSRTFRVELAGDLPLGPSVALLGRSNWWQQEVQTAQGTGIGRRDRSLLGLALRPVGSDVLNALVRMEWRRNADAAIGGVLGARGEDTRLIGSTDLIWSARPGTEVTGRYALRWTIADAMLPGYSSLGTQSHFMGTRLDQELRGPLRARLDGRLLAVGADRTTYWNAAPSLVMRVARQIDVEGGYRFGNLLDPDFGAQGGHGWFASLGLHFTEGTLGSAAEFWRDRLARDR